MAMAGRRRWNGLPVISTRRFTELVSRRAQQKRLEKESRAPWQLKEAKLKKAAATRKEKDLRSQEKWRQKVGRLSRLWPQVPGPKRRPKQKGK